MSNIHNFLVLAEYKQTEYAIGWALTIGLLLLGLLVVCIPRPRKTVPKEMQAMEERRRANLKKKKENQKKGGSSSQSSRGPMAKRTVKRRP